MPNINYYLKSKIFIISWLLLFACQPERKPEASFYYWKSNFQLSVVEKSYLNQLKVRRLYVKFFDVDWDFANKQALPLATLEVSEKLPEILEIVPVVFITNRTLVQIKESQLPAFGKQISLKIKALADKQKVTFSEIQLDCDWSEKSKQNFFQLVGIVKKQVPNTQISVTVRLHQLKYSFQTGVPPADKGMLMFYNMGKLDGSNTENSILDNTLAKAYLRKLPEYPLPLDIALPIYSWAVLKRANKIINLLNFENEKIFADTAKFEKLSENKFLVRESHYLNAVYLYQDDEIRLEKVDFEALEEAVKLLKPVINQANPHIVFYHLDSQNLQNLSYENLEILVNYFR
ncbi:MAG: hypothetical protein H7Y04_11905 [Verrucomicrobia bacterium]|nr:hypothetical protein [Cytophagales bacterium]